MVLSSLYDCIEYMPMKNYFERVGQRVSSETSPQFGNIDIYHYECSTVKLHLTTRGTFKVMVFSDDKKKDDAVIKKLDKYFKIV